jgi:protein-disulfide isomerase
VKTSSIGKALVGAALLAAALIATTSVMAGQQSQADRDRQRIAALEETQKAILQELKEIKSLLQQRPVPVPMAQGAPQPAAPPLADLTVGDAPSRGKASAKLTIIEFSDFECPFCARYTAETLGQIDRDYVSTGKVRYVFRNFPLSQIHPNAMKAAEAGECARVQGKFWEYHDRLFANQKSLGVSDLVRHATDLGLNVPAFQQCLGGQVTVKIRNDLREAAQAGMGGTPTFFIGTPTADGKVHVLRKLVGAQPYAAFKATLDELLAAAK